MRRLLAALLVFSAFTAPSHALTNTVNFCARKSDGVVHSIPSGKCKSSEYSLGAKPIPFPKTRPQGVVSQLMSRYWAARTAAKKVGVYLRITSGYRRLADQEYLFKQAIKKYGSAAKASRWVLPPQYSTHPWGIALDVNFRTKLKKGALWLENNGYKWGLCRTYDNEWWHFEGSTVPGQKCPARWKDAVDRFPESVK